MKEMKCITWHGERDLRYGNRIIPDLNEDEVLVKIAYTGICGSDIHLIHNGKLNGKKVENPIVLGHEYSGIVEEVGCAVETVVPGDKVIGNPIAPCGECHYCRNGMENMCTNPFAIITPPGGVRDRQPGAFSQYIRMKGKQLYKIPDDISLKHAALIEPVTIAIHSVDKAQMKSGETVVIVGGGPIGLLILQVARLCGAGKVILSEPQEVRRKLALKLGADIVVNPYKDNLTDVVIKETENRGTEICFEATGVPNLIKDCFSLLAHEGRLIQVGFPEVTETVPIFPFQFYRYEIEYKGVQLAPYCYDRAIRLMNRLDIESMISHCLPLKSFIEALALKDAIKILLQP